MSQAKFIVWSMRSPVQNGLHLGLSNAVACRYDGTAGTDPLS
jgi:hypothetical protein